MDPHPWLSDRTVTLARHGFTASCSLASLLLLGPYPAEGRDARPSVGEPALVEDVRTLISDPHDAAGGDPDVREGGKLSFSPYLRAGAFGGYRRVADEILSDDNPDTPANDLWGAGAVLDLSRRFSLDLGAFSTSAELERRTVLFPREPAIPVVLTAEPHVIGLRTALRYYLTRSPRVSSWLSLGARGMAVRSDRIEKRSFEERTEIAQTEERELFDLTVGAGVDCPVSPRISLTFDAEYGLDRTGWTAGIGFSFHPEERRSFSPFRAFSLDLDVDTNRDGQVEDAADDPGENEFRGSQGGAIVIANVDDDDGDCSDDAARNVLLGRNQGPCPPDAGDDEIDGRDDFFDLAPVVIRPRPGLRLFGARYALRIKDDIADPWVHVFHGGRVVLGPEQGAARGGYREWTIPPQLLNQEIRLFVEARYYATGEFDGLIDLELVSRSFFRTRVVDAVRLKVAPWIMAHHLQDTEEVWVRPYSDDQHTEPDLRAILSPRNLADLVVLPSGTVWVQDAHEVGYSVAPRSPGSGVTRMHSSSTSPRYAAQRRRPHHDFGSFNLCHTDLIPRPSCGGSTSLDSFGNLEVTPPLPGWPLGRIYYGGRSGTSERIVEEVRTFLKAQQVQAPALELDTTWLHISHTDETAVFIPNPGAGPGEKPFKVLVASPAAAARILFGPPFPNNTCSEPGNEEACRAASPWSYPNLTAHFRTAQVRIQLTEGLGLEPDDFIPVPVLFRSIPTSSSPGLTADLPNMVNLLVASGDLVIPDPKSPALKQYMQDQLQAIGYNAAAGPRFHFIDTQDYHDGAGEIHCGTNSVRVIPETPWWELIN